MKTPHYPKNKSMEKQDEIVHDLEESQDWEAAKLARKKLNRMIKNKQKWMKENF